MIGLIEKGGRSRLKKNVEPRSMRLVTPLEQMAKQIEAAPIPDLNEPEPSEAYGLDSDAYLEELGLAIEAKKRRLEAEKEQEADERMALYER